MNINFDDLKTKSQQFANSQNDTVRDEWHCTAHSLYNGIIGDLLEYLTCQYKMESAANPPTMQNSMITPASELKNARIKRHTETVNRMLLDIEKNIISANDADKLRIEHSVFLANKNVVDDVIAALRDAGYVVELKPATNCDGRLHIYWN